MQLTVQPKRHISQYNINVPSFRKGMYNKTSSILYSLGKAG